MLRPSIVVLAAWLHIVLGQTDRCPDGWERFESSCYLFEDQLLLNWTEADNFCSSHHQSKLAVIESKDEDTMLIDHLRRLYKPGSNRSVWFWLGAKDDEIEGVWTWYTDYRHVSSGYMNWAPNQPDNYYNQDCLCYWGPENFIWQDNNCEAKSHAICEKNMTSTQSEIIG